VGDLVYDPLAHWVWVMGMAETAGRPRLRRGTVVHISSGVSALAAVLVIGKRGGSASIPCPRTTALDGDGASLLWFGCSGSMRERAWRERAGRPRVHHHQHRRRRRRPRLDAHGVELARQAHRARAASGAVAGLVAVTPAAGFVTPMAALVIGALAGILCYSACTSRPSRL